jgi:pantoate--beta-alanine ligase
MTPLILREKSQLRRLVKKWKSSGETVAVVPTMGALHEGHLSLVRAAVERCDRVIVTIFVNPKQFNNPDDLENYPRTEEADALKLAPLGGDLVYVPDPDQIYPPGFATNVRVAGLTDSLCGSHRPGHFDGVATVVAKLFLQTQADVAFFGEKDFQQLQVVRRMARDLDIPIKITGCPTVREPDGLAMSSRNLHLSPAAREVAAELHRAMSGIVAGLVAGKSFAPLQQQAVSTLEAAGFDTVEYLELRARDDLALLETAHRPARLFGAAMLENVRLIDNLDVPVVG